MTSVVLTVKGMSCGHCVNSIESALRELSGVAGAQVNLKEENVAVTYEENRVSLKQIKEAIEEQGYDVV